MYRLKGTTLLETIVASLLFLIVFGVAMELMPRFAVRNDDAALVTEADFRTMQTFEKYTTGLWPCGEYSEMYDWGKITIRIAPYPGIEDLQVVDIAASIAGSGRRIGFRQIIERKE